MIDHLTQENGGALLKEDGGAISHDGFVSVTEVQIVGSRAFHYFTNTTTQELVRVPCTLAEYDSLAVQGAAQPSNGSGFVWVNSVKENEYDTVDGDLHDDQYAVTPSGHKVVRLSFFPPLLVDSVEADEIVNGKIDALKFT